ncbi:acetyl-CoA C-acetyltransferase [Psychrobacter sp. AH5]|uniref:acetyl-CoA C-acetyltransferase n=1 Tax=Psychrobacter sp. AH5 TaxID=2937433 RepID=UPI0035305136
MSNKKDSPIVGTTVVKGNDSTTTDTQAAASQTSDKDHTANYESIADLKQHTEIVDADGQPVTKSSTNEQADKKAKIKQDMANEAEAAKQEELEATTQSKSVEPEASKEADADKAKADNADKKASEKPADEKKPASSSRTATTKNTNEKKAMTEQKTEQKEAPKAAAKKATTAASKKSATSSNSSGLQRVAILGGNRIPFARSNGAYADASNIDMLTAALNGLVERYDLQGELIGEVVAGAVLKLSRDLNLTREAALNTALNPHTPTYDIAQACGTGLQATFASANKIALGLIDSAITGGVDTTSDAPIAIGDGLRKAMIKLGAAKDNKQRLKALMSINPKDLIDSPQNGEPRTGLSMGDHQAITALEWNISREDQDQLAFNSHQNLARAYDEGFFDDLITPYKGLTRDNNLRPDTTLEKLAKLKPVFGKKNANPTMTAANSTPLTDGASCVLLANDEWAKEHGLKPLAYIVHQETAAVDFIGKSGDKEGLLMAPAYAVPRMLERAGLTLQDFDFYEIHEAFASQVLSTLAAWEDETFCQERLGLDAPLGSIDRSKLNVNGSSLAAGHPFAATGGRILATAAKLLDQKGSGRALISICAAGGQGVTCILEK